MIRLMKGAPPRALVENADAWRAEYLALLDGTEGIPDAAKYRYRHPEVKEAIRQETHDKCAYCESRVSHVYPGDCEHILPKSRFPKLVVEWINLTFVCAECNRRKSDYAEDAHPLINPYIDDPDAHLRFVGPLVFQRPGDLRGMRTVTVLELSRPALVERRKERLEQMQRLLHVWASIPEGPDRDIVANLVEKETQDDQEYAAVVRAMLAASPDWRPSGALD